MEGPEDAAHAAGVDPGQNAIAADTTEFAGNSRRSEQIEDVTIIRCRSKRIAGLQSFHPLKHGRFTRWRRFVLAAQEVDQAAVDSKMVECLAASIAAGEMRFDLGGSLCRELAGSESGEDIIGGMLLNHLYIMA